jgi:hypothetical protein
VPQFYSFSISATAEAYFAAFVASALVASWISSGKKKSEEALKDALDQLEVLVSERTAELMKTQTELAHLSQVLITVATPAIKLGIISLVVLSIAVVALNFLHLTWRKTFVIGACAVLYFNVFVLVVQSFEKIPSLKVLVPTQKEPPLQSCKSPSYCSL